MDPRGTRKASFSVGVQRGHFFAFFEWSFIEMWRCYWSRAYHDQLEGVLVGDTTHIHFYLPNAQTLAWKVLPGTKVMPGYKFGGKTVINFQMAVEIYFLFGKTIILLRSDRVSVICFARFGYFFSESWVISNSKITCLYFVPFHIWIFGWGNPLRLSKSLLKCTISGS